MINDQSACEWVHIQCDSNKQIISIIIAETNLSGTIPHALGALSKLQRIRMQVNKLKGTIPRQVAALPNLIEFNIFENRITGTLPYFASTQLEILNLGHNDLHGSIPNKFIASKNKLQQLRMPQNRLAGFIPDTLMALKRLDTLDLSSNQRLTDDCDDEIYDHEACDQCPQHKEDPRPRIDRHNLPRDFMPVVKCHDLK